jgi:integrase
VKLYPTGPLFPDRWSRSRLVQDMRKVAKRARVPVVSANDFRRTFATFCGDSGVDETTCYRWMGHTSGAMIRRVSRAFRPQGGETGALLSQYKAEATTELAALHKAADDERD